MQIGHPLLLFPLPLVLIYRAEQRLAKRKAWKEKLVKSGFAAPMNAMPPTAGTQFFEVCLSAQPVGDFWIWSAVCDGQPPVLDDLTPSCQITPQRFFFCTVSGTFSFWQDKKKMWGTFCTAKPCLPVPHSGTVVHPCGDSPHILGPPFQGEPFKGALQWPNVNPPPI